MKKKQKSIYHVERVISSKCPVPLRNKTTKGQIDWNLASKDSDTKWMGKEAVQKTQNRFLDFMLPAIALVSEKKKKI